MIDGKVCNAVTCTSSAQVCYICAASPKEIHATDDAVRIPVNTTALKFGLSTLHAWIRFFEFFLLDIKKWQAGGDDYRRKIKTRKEIQK